MTQDTQNDNAPVDIQAELHHYDEHIRAQLAAMPETGEEKQEKIERAARALEAAKQRFYMLNRQQGSGADQEDPELDRLLHEVRQTFRQIDEKADGGGPPLA